MATIRPATLEDVLGITALLCQLGYPETPEDVREHLSALCGQADSAILVAQDDRGRLTGCAQVLIDHRLAEGRRGEIASIVVDGRLRGRGTGARLVQAAGAWLASRGVQRMRVRCNAARDRARRFYERLGFQLTKTQNVFDIPIDGLSGPSAEV